MMWECFAGKTPYYFLKNPQAIIKYVYYEGGRPAIKDIKKPVDPELIELMENTWDKEPEVRKEFHEIIPILEKHLKSFE